ncbi:MAG: glycosyltransferase [Aquihabitans sp.]
MTVFALVLVVGIGWWQLRNLRALAAPLPAPSGQTASVIVPARNEADTLPDLLRSLADQTRRADQVVVVDDESDDATLATAVAAGCAAFTAAPRPEGWVGKPWACAEGARAAKGDVLVFLDADVRLAPDALERLLATYADQGGGLLSVQPHHRAERWWEQLSALPNLVSVLAAGALKRGGSPTPIAFGPCLVSDRASYEQAGTHAAVAGEVIEDLALAQAYDRAGLPVRCAIGGSTVSYRMYPGGLRQLVEGWTKNLAGGPGYVPAWSLAVSIAWVLALSSIVGVVSSAPWDGWPASTLASWALTAATVSWMVGRIGSFRWWAGPAFPLLWLAFVMLFARSALFRALGRVTWRGRAIPSASS